MPTSATERGTVTAAAVLREATRRLSHQAANAANAAAVNVEVLRSRLSRAGAPAESMVSFAERAAAAAEQMSAGVTAIRALLNALSDAAGSDDGDVRLVRGDRDAVEIRGGAGIMVDAAAVRFAESAGVGLSASSTSVILKVQRRGAADTDASE